MKPDARRSRSRRFSERILLPGLKTVAALAALLGVTACDPINDFLRKLQNRTANAASSDFVISPGAVPNVHISIRLSGNAPVSGGKEQIVIKGQSSIQNDYLKMDYYWSPPFPDVKDVTFSHPPENPQGPPPYRWKRMPREWGDDFQSVVINYTYPETSGEQLGHESVKYEAYTDGFFDSTVSRPDVATRPVILNQSPPRILPPAPAGRTAPERPAGHASASEDYLYYTGYYHMDMPMTPESCQAYADALAGGSVFFAVQTPVAALGIDGGFVRSSVLPDRGDIRSRVELVNYPASTAGFSAALVEAPEFINALESASPSPEGLMWTPLRMAPQLLDNRCAAFTGTEEWMLLLKLVFDNALENSTFPSYFCYAGDNPFLIETFRQAAGKSGLPLRQTASAAEPCVTCLGPNPVILKTYADIVPDLACSWFNLSVLPNGQRIAFWHMAYNVPGPCNLGLAYNQTPPSPLGWTFYEDKGLEPDLAKPITSLDSNRTFWVVSDQVDGSVLPGEYSIRVQLVPQGTIGSPAWASDSAWVLPLTGDLNNDGAVNALDLALLANYLSANSDLPGLALLAADNNQDGTVNALDGTLLNRAVVTR